MRSYIVKCILKKEMLEILRDKKTLFMTFILPILLYPALIMLVFYIMNASTSTMQQKILNIAFSEPPTKELMKEIDGDKEEERQFSITQTSDYEKDLVEGRIDAYIEVNTPKKTGEKTTYKVYINSSSNNGNEASNRLMKILEDYKVALTKQKLLDLGLDEASILEPIAIEVQNVAQDEAVMGSILGVVLPFILIMGLISGAVTPAIDTMAGEKERGTLETLLTIPISNLELVMGKYLAVSISALASALLNVLSIAISIGFLFLNVTELMEEVPIQIDISQLGLPLLITLICILLFTLVISAVAMCLCALAKSFKDAQNVVTPLILICMLLSYSSMIPTLELTKVTAGIPVVNIVLLIKTVLSLKYDMVLILIVLVSNAIFVSLSVWALSKLFKSEEVLFGNAQGFSFLEKRENIQKGTMPTVGDGIMLYSILFLALLYGGSYLQLKFKMLGLVMTQVILFLVPILLCIYIKADFKKVYSLKKLKGASVLGGLILWMGVLVFSLMTVNLLLVLFPIDTAYMEELQNTILSSDSIWINLLVVAVAPAICEETLFRGFIFTSFSGKGQYKRGIILSGLLFGLMHMDLVRLIPTTCLGIAIAYAVYKTGSIAIGVIIHFSNNAFSVLSQDVLHPYVVQIEQQVEAMNPFVAIIGSYMLAILFVAIGVIILKKNNENKQVQVI